MSSQIPKDLTGRILQVGDFCLFTHNNSGYINFGYITEIKEIDGRYSNVKKTLRIKMKHADRNGVVEKETGWDSVTAQRITLDKDYETWLNYTYAERFLVTQPI